MQISNADMLSRMKIDAFKAEGGVSDDPSAKTGFQAALKNAVESVVESQEHSKQLSERFAIGDPKVSLVDSKIASEVAEVKTQILIATTQKVLKAYRDISTMSI